MPVPTADQHSYDICAAYTALRKQDQNPLPPALAAVSALVTALRNLSPQTVSETLSLLHALAQDLKGRVRNPTIIAAGTDVFQRYLVTTLARTGHTGPDREPIKNVIAAEKLSAGKTDDLTSADDFQVTKAAIIRAGELYVQKSLNNRVRASKHGRKWVRHGWTVIVPAPSQAVTSLLTEAAEEGKFFRVVLVQRTAQDDPRYTPLENAMRNAETPVTRIAADSVANAIAHMSKSDVRDWPGAEDKTVILSGAAAVLSTGGIMAARGTLQAAYIAQALHREFWVVAQSMGCPRWSVEDQRKTFDFSEQSAPKATSDFWEDEEMDIIPPEVICAIITQDGIQQTSALAEEAIRIWF